MPQASAFDTTPAPGTPARGIGPVLRHLPAAVAILAICGWLVTTAFDRTADIHDTPRLIPAPSAAPVVASGGDHSVPDASTVFSGREAEVEEPIPTF